MKKNKDSQLRVYSGSLINPDLGTKRSRSMKQVTEVTMKTTGGCGCGKKLDAK